MGMLVLAKPHWPLGQKVFELIENATTIGKKSVWVNKEQITLWIV